MTEKKWVHVVSDGKLIGVGYGDVEEIRKSLPKMRKEIKEMKYDYKSKVKR